MSQWLQAEYGILDAIAALRCGALDALMPLISRLSDSGAIWIFLGLVLLCIPAQRKLGMQVWLALLLSVLVCNVLLKNVVARERPFELLEGIQLIINAPHDFSFPSGHSSASFAAASVLLFRRWRWAIPAIVLAALTAFSRLYLYVHFPTDVLAGIALGIVLGYLATKLFALLEARVEARKGEKVP